MNDTITIFVCNSCGAVAHAYTGKHLDHPAFKNRTPITHVECHDITCQNHMKTLDWRADDPQAVAQVSERYTPVPMDESQVARFIEAVDFTARGA